MSKEPKTVSRLVKQYFDQLQQLELQFERRLKRSTNPERYKDAMRFVRAETRRFLRENKQ